MARTGTGTTGQRHMRADARRNYDLLLETAAAVFAEQGVNARLDEIVKRAGVGSGTLYRHFPTRESLLDAIFADRVRALCDLAYDLMKRPDRVAALRTWLLAVIRHSVTYRGLAATQVALLIDESQASGEARHDQIRWAGCTLLNHVQESGQVLSEIEISDLLKLVNAIAWAVEQTPSPSDQVNRMLAVVMRGIVVDPGEVPQHDLDEGGGAARRDTR